MEEEIISITREEFEKLVRDSMLLNCLKNAGVDDWDGYDFAIEEFLNVE